MNRKFLILIGIIIIAMILNEIFTALELVWYIQLLPFAVAIIGYIILILKGEMKFK